MECSRNQFRDDNKTHRLKINVYLKMLLLSNNIQLNVYWPFLHIIVKLILSYFNEKMCHSKLQELKRKLWNHHTLKWKGRQGDAADIHKRQRL